MRAALILAAGGQGRRFGRNKQLYLYENKPLFIRTIERFPAPEIAQLIVAAGSVRKFQKILAEHKIAADVVAGGRERSDSVRNALAVLRADITHVFIHDGARPNVSPELITRLRREAEIYDAVIPVLPVTDTIKVVKDGVVVLTPKRADLFAVQTQQVFRKKTILQAYARIDARGCTDDAMLVEKMGGAVYTVPGDPANIKITTPHDLAVL